LSDSGERSVAVRLGGAQFASEIVAFCTVCGVWVASRLTTPTTQGRILKEGTPVGARVCGKAAARPNSRFNSREGHEVARSITSALRFPN
jgi:hypothetical protein